MENQAERCPTCGGKASPGVSVRTGPDPDETDSRRDWSDSERKKWLLGELRTAVAIILGNALQGFAFAALGGLLGYLVADVKGLVVGAILLFVVQLLF